MAYDEELADRIRSVIVEPAGVTERAMFGALGFMADGRLAVSAGSQGDLLVRVDPAQTESLVAGDGAARYEMRGRAMNGWLHVRAEAVLTDDQLQRWVEIGLAYARSLPPK